MMIAGTMLIFGGAVMSTVGFITSWLAILAGIGFTMSLFISELAFSANENVEAAKSAILVASALAAIIGLLVIRLTNPKKQLL